MSSSARALRTRRRPAPTTTELDAAVGAARAFVAVTVEGSDTELTPAQMRMLALARAHPGCNLSALAGWMGVHPSNATRVCDRLVRQGLMQRIEDPTDRRHVQLGLTPAGDEVIDGVVQRRRRAMRRVLQRMVPGDRADLTRSLQAFAEAAGEVHDDGLWPIRRT
jgi:DNA-binding MarR family transcriptional regulator